MVQPAALLFDLDGTLWDTTPVIATAWQQALYEMGLEKQFQVDAQTVKGIAGLSREPIFQRVFPGLEPGLRFRLSERCEVLENEKLSLHGGLLYAGVKELIPQLASRYFIGIISNCQSGYIEMFLKFSQLQPYVHDYACFGDQQLPKATNISQVINTHKLTSAVYVGDTSWDQEAALKAGIPFWHAAYGFGKLTQAPEKSLNSFSDLRLLLVEH